MRADLRAALDSTLADICKAVDSKLTEIRREFGLLCHDLALGAGEGSYSAPMLSDAAASIDLGHKTLQRVGQPDGDGSPLRISSVIPIDSVPPLLSSSPLLRAMAISPVKAHLKDSLASTIHTSVQDFLTDKCGWVNWYLVGKFVKKDFYALELFEKMSEKGSVDKMEISHWRDLSSFEITNYIWNPSGCTIIVELLEIACYMGLEFGWIMIKGFADEEIYVQLHESVRGSGVYLVQLTCPPANENFILVMSGACRLTVGRRIHEYMLKVGLTRNSQVTNAQLDLYAKSENKIIIGISYNAIKIAIKPWINLVHHHVLLSSYFSLTNLECFQVVRGNQNLLCTGGYPSAFTPTYSTLLIGTEPHSKRVKVTWEVQSDVLHGAIIGANKKHRCESRSRVHTIPVQWVVSVQLHQHASPKPTIFYLEQLIVKHGAAASAIENKALVIESLRRGVNQQQNRGIDKLAGVIGLSFGPRGRNVVLDECGSPKVVNEGVKFGRAIELPHDIGTVGEARIREVFSKTNDSEGDRTTNTLKKGSECTKGTYLDLACSLEGHLESNFGALAIDLHADFSLLFTSKFDFWPVWDPGDTSAKAVKLILCFQYKDSKRMGAFVNLFFRRELQLKSFDVEQRAVVVVELQTCLFTSVALQVLMLHNWWSYASSLAPKVEPSTTLLLITKEVLVQKLYPQAILAQLNSRLPSKNNKFTLRLQGSLIEFHCKQFQISIANPNLEDKMIWCLPSSRDKRIPIYVVIPVDAFCSDGTGRPRIRTIKALTVALEALKLVGVHGIVERRAFGGESLGLKLHVALSFHSNVNSSSSRKEGVTLPLWIIEIGDQNKHIYYWDQNGFSNDDYLTLGVDHVPLFCRWTALHCYEDFMSSFAKKFEFLIGTVIEEISVGLGPSGELRYPAHPFGDGRWKFPGIGEFQCYEKYISQCYEMAARKEGKPQWEEKGPQRDGCYNSLPCEVPFFGEGEESFLSDYGGRLLHHADDILARAANILKKYQENKQTSIAIAHPAELTAGYYNTAVRYGYDPVTSLLSRVLELEV
ncbi:inactive beta-amylase 4 [Pyrus ussuriensis x Pyrus communis]|uniref:Beta-amylase n=1 Tax=Pyrus ussuriensis x Pyrus communis TaxID=2448454 RepID=A0A5N5GQH3_9ROSA|nr:inactive beta-amylase 4 [Pyrus ussuriensis x Pyrus communis]